jgi:hypothetical protein
LMFFCRPSGMGLLLPRACEALLQVAIAVA